MESFAFLILAFCFEDLHVDSLLWWLWDHCPALNFLPRREFYTQVLLVFLSFQPFFSLGPRAAPVACVDNFSIGARPPTRAHFHSALRCFPRRPTRLSPCLLSSFPFPSVLLRFWFLFFFVLSQFLCCRFPVFFGFSFSRFLFLFDPYRLILFAGDFVLIFTLLDPWVWTVSSHSWTGGGLSSGQFHEMWDVFLTKSASFHLPILPNSACCLSSTTHVNLDKALNDFF